MVICGSGNSRSGRFGSRDITFLGINLLVSILAVSTNIASWWGCFSSWCSSSSEVFWSVFDNGVWDLDMGFRLASSLFDLNLNAGWSFTPDNTGAAAKNIEVTTRCLHRFTICLFITISLLKIDLTPWFLATGNSETLGDRLCLVEIYPSVG